MILKYRDLHPKVTDSDLPLGERAKKIPLPDGFLMIYVRRANGLWSNREVLTLQNYCQSHWCLSKLAKDKIGMEIPLTANSCWQLLKVSDDGHICALPLYWPFRGSSGGEWRTSTCKFSKTKEAVPGGHVCSRSYLGLVIFIIRYLKPTHPFWSETWKCLTG